MTEEFPKFSEVFAEMTQGSELSPRTVRRVFDAIFAGAWTPAMMSAFLVGLRLTGNETPRVIAAAASAMRAVMVAVPHSFDVVLDTCGTGGDGSGSLNLSTGAALVAAAAGVPVAKHGNRAATSRAGSADVLEALGLRIPMAERQTIECLQAANFAFFFAPHYHPAMKALAPVRTALGVKTIFNILGPLTNPATPPCHLMGAFSPQVARLMADTLSGMDIERTFVVHGAQGWDEPTPLGPFVLFDVRPGHVEEQIRHPADYGLRSCVSAELAGGDAACNARALESVMSGRDRGAHRDSLLLGAALALEVTGKVRSGAEGIECAAAAIDSGAARRVLESLRAISAGTAGGESMLGVAASVS